MTIQSVGLDFSPVYKVQELNRKKMGTDFLTMTTGIFAFSPLAMGENYITKNPKNSAVIAGVSLLCTLASAITSHKIGKEIEEIRKQPVKFDVQA